MVAPKVFLSYAWTSQEHIEWVVRLATDLRTQGVDVILDKWKLREGHDANAFMEQMISDESVSRVIMVCDKLYCEKANARKGGVGTEAQIISPTLYTKKEQEKFVAVVREKDVDGRALVPVFYGARVYIDLSDPDRYSEGIEQLLRWAFGKPQFVEPPLGNRPDYLDQPPSQRIGDSQELRSAMEALKRGAPNALALAEEYLLSVTSDLEAIRIPQTEEIVEFEEKFLSSIDDFLPTRNEIVELFSAISRYADKVEASDILVRFFEKFARYQYRPDHVTRFRNSDWDNFKFLANELFLYLVAVLIKREKFEFLDRVFSASYFIPGQHGAQGTIGTFCVFAGFVDSLQNRNDRLRLGRASLKADMLRERCNGAVVSFQEIMQADLVIYVRYKISELVGVDMLGRWFPHTLIFAGRFSGAFELFVRASSNSFFERLKPALLVESPTEFVEQLHKIGIINYGMERLSFPELCNSEQLATR